MARTELIFPWWGDGAWSPSLGISRLCSTVPRGGSEGLLLGRRGVWFQFEERHGRRERTIHRCSLSPRVSILHVNHPIFYTSVINIDAVSARFSYLILFPVNCNYLSVSSLFFVQGGEGMGWGFFVVLIRVLNLFLNQDNREDYDFSDYVQ